MLDWGHAAAGGGGFHLVPLPPSYASLEAMKSISPHLDGKTAVVTGGGSGIGRATAIQHAQACAQVALIGRTWDETMPAIAEMKGCGGRPFAAMASLRCRDPYQRRRALPGWRAIPAPKPAP